MAPPRILKIGRPALGQHEDERHIQGAADKIVGDLMSGVQTGNFRATIQHMNREKAHPHYMQVLDRVNQQKGNILQGFSLVDTEGNELLVRNLRDKHINRIIGIDGGNEATQQDNVWNSAIADRPLRLIQHTEGNYPPRQTYFPSDGQPPIVQDIAYTIQYPGNSTVNLNRDERVVTTTDGRGHEREFHRIGSGPIDAWKDYDNTIWRALPGTEMHAFPKWVSNRLDQYGTPVTWHGQITSIENDGTVVLQGAAGPRAFLFRDGRRINQ